MANLEEAIRNAAQKLADQLGDTAELKVETRYVILADGEQFDPTAPDKSFLAALTTIELDGDQKTVVPMTQLANQGGLAIQKDLLDLHKQSVDSAIEYRAKAFSAIVDLLRSFSR